MMLYSFTKKNKFLIPDPLNNLEIEEIDSPFFMAGLEGISVNEARERFAEDNKAFVAIYNGLPAGFGWMAMSKIEIRDLNVGFILPLWHRFLWNFRTLPAFQDKGIYLRLLCHVISVEQGKSECFWTMHSPENKASAKKIKQAGFMFRSRVSFEKGAEFVFDDFVV